MRECVFFFLFIGGAGRVCECGKRRFTNHFYSVLFQSLALVPLNRPLFFSSSLLFVNDLDILHWHHTTNTCTQHTFRKITHINPSRESLLIFRRELKWTYKYAFDVSVTLDGSAHRSNLVWRAPSNALYLMTHTGTERVDCVDRWILLRENVIH